MICKEQIHKIFFSVIFRVVLYQGTDRNPGKRKSKSNESLIYERI
jgi:hypothetical protein